jgi:CDGSH-type Zn-finger protein
MIIHPQYPARFQDHLVLETDPPFRIILYWTILVLLACYWHATIREMAKITPVNNGPIRIEGEFTIHDQQGNEFGLAGRTAISLCRCGQSANKPFCDGSHARTGFQDTCVARELPPPKPKL